MDYKGLIDFNKYTLALAAAGFVYALEKFVPMETQAGRYLLLGLLAVLFISILSGVALFAAATAALHADSGRRQRIRNSIPWFGVAHTILLCIGMILLGIMLHNKVMSVPQAETPVACGF